MTTRSFHAPKVTPLVLVCAVALGLLGACDRDRPPTVSDPSGVDAGPAVDSGSGGTDSGMTAEEMAEEEMAEEEMAELMAEEEMAEEEMAELMAEEEMAELMAEEEMAEDAGASASCVDLSSPSIMCDPMVGQCDGPGSSCDVTSDDVGVPSRTQCFPPPNGTPVGEACSGDVFCVTGSHCHNQDGSSLCRSFCCETSQCPTGFYCDQLQFRTVKGAESLGICLPE